jgi:hypothetical protein
VKKSYSAKRKLKEWPKESNNVGHGPHNLVHCRHSVDKIKIS